MRNPLRLPPALVEALLSLTDVAARLPELAAGLEERGARLEEDIAAMRQAIEGLDAVRRAVEPLDGRLKGLERESGPNPRRDEAHWVANLGVSDIASAHRQPGSDMPWISRPIPA